MGKTIYAIESSNIRGLDGTPYLLAWQPYDWDDGYFWTQKEIFLQLIHTDYNIDPHKFTFKSREEAINFAKKDNLKNYRIIKLEA